MTHAQFIDYVEDYYQPITSKTVKIFIMKEITQYSESQLDSIFNSLISLFLKQYKPEIDVGAIQKAAQHAQTGMREVDGEIFYDGRFIGHRDSGRFIPAVYVLTPSVRQKYVIEYRNYEYPEAFLELVRESDTLRIEYESRKQIEP